MTVNLRVRGALSPPGNSSSVWVSSCQWQREKVPRSPGQRCWDTDVSSAAQQCGTGSSFERHALGFISVRHENLSGYLGAHIAQLHCFEQIEGAFVT